jgi:hypothetical protein
VAKAERMQNNLTRELDAELLEQKVKLMELRRGPAAAATYRMCHTYPPTTKQHELECKRLDAQFRRDEAIKETFSPLLF